jgi:hypothetical protein
MNPHDEQLHLVKRYRCTDFSHPGVDITVEEPRAFTKPWSIHSVWNLAPGEEIGGKLTDLGPFSNSNVYAITSVSKNGTPKAVPSSIASDNKDFSIAWLSAGP